ncbi:MAG: cysteine desulfurase-like protein [Candidatus Sumerlaeia bacterium]|nr:cysteine desulfurase-like protein [Candidatus Sumerlaeia bacterium]
MSLNVAAVRTQFPALDLTVAGRPAIFFDGPGGTQMPQRVIDRMVRYLVHENANTGGPFATSVANDAMLANARAVFADYFNCAADEVAFCHNSTTICFKLAQAIARDLQRGDEILVTDIDHEANRSPWTVLADRGIVVQSVRVNPQTCTLDLDDLAGKLTKRTKVVAFNAASNAVGTISDAKAIVRLARSVGALTVADAVHYALHRVIDVQDLGVDFMFCSAYKFFGPHVGVLYARRERLEALRTLKVVPQKDYAPDMFETGTLNHEGIAGAAEAVEFLADVGRHHAGSVAGPEAGNERRRAIARGVLAMEEHEQPLAQHFREQLARIPGLRLYGPPAGHPCTSTISFRLGSWHPDALCQRLAERGIFTWAGSFYAVRLVEVLGLRESGGLLRIGLAPYNTRDEVDRALVEIRALAAESA